MSKLQENAVLVELRAVYVRMPPELVRWLDREAKRRKRSRAYLITQACSMLRAFIEQERGTLDE